MLAVHRDFCFLWFVVQDKSLYSNAGNERYSDSDESDCDSLDAGETALRYECKRILCKLLYFTNRPL